jgi:hypothetical protein
MEKAMTIAEILARCEAAPAFGGKDGERERFQINCAIEAAIFGRTQGMMRSFTESLDAARKLSGDCFSIQYRPLADLERRWMAWIRDQHDAAYAQTAEMALVMAALKERLRVEAA